MRKPVIIAYGNPLRQDDGVAWRAVDFIASRLPAGMVRIYCCHQLAPELAAQLQDAPVVILLDAAASRDPSEVEVSLVSAQPFGVWSHDLQPGQLLAVARDLFSATPPAFLITATVSAFGFDDHITDAAERCAVLMADRAIEILRQYRRREEPVTIASCRH